MIKCTQYAANDLSIETNQIYKTYTRTDILWNTHKECESKGSRKDEKDVHVKRGVFVMRQNAENRIT